VNVVHDCGREIGSENGGWRGAESVNENVNANASWYPIGDAEESWNASEKLTGDRVFDRAK